VIAKHAKACGVATCEDLLKAYRLAVIACIHTELLLLLSLLLLLLVQEPTSGKLCAKHTNSCGVATMHVTLSFIAAAAAAGAGAHVCDCEAHQPMRCGNAR
jgi:AICAR transformylase/IMP cyclohydrolase PurH